MTRLVTDDGRVLTYRQEGSGPVLVCHPGGPGFSSLYFGDLAGLGANVQLVMVNPRGTADSDRPADRRAYATDDYVGDLEELRRHLALDRVWLLGHSHGGVVAAAYAAEPWYADARAALEAEQAGAFSTDEELAALVFREFPFYFARFGAAEAAYLETLRGEIPNADALWLFNKEIFNIFDLRPRLPRITAPTLVITGEEDFITGPLCARELAGGIGGARLMLLPQCGHFIFVEARERFRQEVLSFLGISG